MRAVTRLGELLGLPVLLLAVWWLVTAGSTDPYVPPLREIVAVFPETWGTDRITSDVLPSLGRLLVGYSLAVLVGIAIGVWIGSSVLMRGLAEPVLEFFRAIPAPVLVPVLIVVAGIDDTMKILVIVLGSLWPVLLNTAAGVRGVDEVLRDTARTYRLGRVTRLRKVTLRSASPQIVAGARQSLSVAIILMVISEMFASSNGLGFTVVQFQRTFAIPQMWTGILVLGALGVLLSLLFGVAERHYLRWYVGQRRLERGA